MAARRCIGYSGTDMSEFNVQQQPASEPTRPCNLERVFGLNNEPFRAYMQIEDLSRRSSVGALRELSEAMQTHDHPLVQYAAGWALAEAGLFRATRRAAAHSAVDRIACLDQAAGIWDQSTEGFERQRKGSADKHEDADLHGFTLRARQARAALPLMRVVAGWLAGAEPHATQTEKAVNESRTAQTAQSARLLEARKWGTELEITRRGAANEYIASLLLHDQTPTEHVVVPASVRQDHHVRSNVRADLVAITVAGSHPRIPIQIARQPKKSNTRLVFGSQQDLWLWPNMTSLDTLKVIVANNQGNLTNVRKKQRIAYVAANLQSSLQAFEANRRRLNGQAETA